MTLLILKNNYIYNRVKMYTYKPPDKHYYDNKHFLWSLMKSVSTKQKYIITTPYTQNYYKKKFYFFSSQCIRMSGNNKFCQQKNQNKQLLQQKQKNI